jgi:hypothetical protein
MAADDRPEINMSRIKVAGIGGLGLVAVVVGMAVEMPVVRVFAIVSAAGGILGGLAFIAYRRWVKPDPPHGPTLMVEMSSETARTADHVDDTAFKLSPVGSPR